MSTARERETPATLIVLWVAKLVAATFLGIAAYLKLTSAPVEIELFTKLDMEPAGRFIIGVLEMLSAILILLPQSAIYGAFLGLGVMTGAIIGHLTALGIQGVQNAVLVAVCCVVILAIRRKDALFIKHLFDR